MPQLETEVIIRNGRVVGSGFTVNDGTLTLKNGDQTKGTFGANQSTDDEVIILPFDITGNTTIGFTPVYPS